MTRWQDLITDLASRGAVTTAWEPAFRAVARHSFIPKRIWLTDDTAADRHMVDRDADPGTWWSAAIIDRPVVTQLDDGGDGPGHITSSISQPTIVATMLAAADIHGTENVLEIGTGTGYSAALLAHRLGDHNVTTIEIDRPVAQRAQRALAAAGFQPKVIVGDGTSGYPEHGPYDRVVSTASAEAIPYAWVEQTHVGGLIVSPWGPHYHNGALLKLVVDKPGHAHGRIIDNAAFMRLRSQRFRFSFDTDEHDPADFEPLSTPLTPYAVAGEYNASLAIGLRVPNCINIYEPGTATRPARLWFVDPISDSWACLTVTPEPENIACQSGARNLWHEIESAHRQWHDEGRPTADQWRIAVNCDRQSVTLG